MIIEYIPLLLFVLAYFFKGMLFATAVLVITSLVVVPIMWIKNKKAPVMHILTAVLVGIFGGLTLFSGDVSFIKMKPTIASLVIAGILLGMHLYGKDPLKTIMGSAFNMEDKYWRILTLRAVGLFVVAAIANEIVWRAFSEQTWVWFKVFGLMGMNILFLIYHFPMLSRNMKNK